MKKVLALILALTMIFCMTACGTGSSGSAAKTSLIIAVDSDYESLHPSDISTTVETNVSNQIYDTLAMNAYDGSEELIPRLATSWDVSEDGLCYTIHLREGVKFHSGETMTADDVAFSIDLYAQSDYQDAVVEGMDYYEVVDANTIKVYTATVYSPFLNSILTDMSIGSKAYFESASEEDFSQKPVGTGPYKWVSRNAGDSFKLEAFEDYWDGAPEIKEVTFKVIGDAASMSVGLLAGQVDFAEIDASVLETLENDSSVTIMTCEQTAFHFVAMNNTIEPYSNVKFRQAVNYAMNREEMVQAVEEGNAVVNSNLLTPDRQGWSADQKSYDYNPELAKQLLAEAGIETPYDLGKFYVRESFKLLAQVVQANLEAVGLTCELEILETNAYFDKVFSGDYGITCMSMALEGDTQQVSMGVCIEGGYANNAMYANPEIDELFAKAASTIDYDERTAVYEEIFTIIQEEVPYCVLYNSTMLFCRSNSLQIPGMLIEGYYFIKDWSFSA